MELLLVVISLASVVLAAIMSIVAWKLLRHGRRRASARIEALESMAEIDDAPPPATAMALGEPPADDPWDLPSYTPEPPSGRAAPLVRHDQFRPDVDSALTPNLTFGGAVVPQPPSHRWVAFAVVATVIFLGVGSAFAIRSAQPVAEFVRGVVQPRPDVARAEPLELLSLRHGTDQSGTFTVTGLVQNPVAGISLDNIVAVVYLFDDNGQYFASGRAHLDVPAFRPGDESPFVVRIPDATGVSRYRVGFRLDDGGVVGHVDRRGQLPHNTTGDALDRFGRSVATPASGSRPVEG
jgi:hypothetical protein